MENQFDSAVELQLDIMRVSASLQNQSLAILRQLEKDLLGEIASGDLTEWGRRRTEQQVKQVQTTIREYYRQIEDIAAAGSDTIAGVAARVTVASIAPEALLPSETVLEALAKGAMIQGATQGQWWAKQSSETAWRFATAVRQGIAAAETNARIINRVRQAMTVSRSNAAALVQTSVATVANDARQASFDKNSDLIKRYRAVATLDAHTCLSCSPLDGLEWLPDGTPIGHSLPRPDYPLHFNCRCLLIPVVLDGPQGGKRASADGPVSARLTFAGWLDRQSVAKQAEILGKGRAELYRKGKLTLTDLVNGFGNPLTLEQLRIKYQ